MYTWNCYDIVCQLYFNNIDIKVWESNPKKKKSEIASETCFLVCLRLLNRYFNSLVINLFGGLNHIILPSQYNVYTHIHTHINWMVEISRKFSSKIIETANANTN